MRKSIVSLVLLVAALVGVAVGQQNSQQGNTSWYFAAAFNKWSLQGAQPDVYTFQAATSCITNPYTSQSYIFATNAPVYIHDLSASGNSELVTPSTVYSAPGTCGFTASPAHDHFNFQVQSGTAGLQEALNWLSKTATTPSALVLDQNFYTQATAIGSSTATLIGAASGGVGINLVDTTTSPFTIYSWNSGTSKYQVAQLSNTVTLTPAAPATTRAIIGSITTSNATMNLSGNVSLVGVRGLATVPAGTTVTGTQGYIEGGQGKLVVAGTLNGSEWAFGLFGQLDVSAATLTAGSYLAPLAADFGATGPGVTCTFCYLESLTNTTATTLGSAVNIYGKASVAWTLNANGSAMLDASSTASGSVIGHILVNINGVAGVLRVYNGS